MYIYIYVCVYIHVYTHGQHNTVAVGWLYIYVYACVRIYMFICVYMQVYTSAKPRPWTWEKLCYWHLFIYPRSLLTYILNLWPRVPPVCGGGKWGGAGSVCERERACVCVCVCVLLTRFLNLRSTDSTPSGRSVYSPAWSFAGLAKKQVTMAHWLRVSLVTHMSCV